MYDASGVRLQAGKQAQVMTTYLYLAHTDKYFDEFTILLVATNWSLSCIESISWVIVMKAMIYWDHEDDPLIVLLQMLKLIMKINVQCYTIELLIFEMFKHK